MRHYCRATAVMAASDLGGRPVLKAPSRCQRLRTVRLDEPCGGPEAIVAESADAR